MAERRLPGSVLLMLLLAGSTVTAAWAETNAARQALRHGQLGEALAHWESNLPQLTGKQRIDTLLRMATAYQALGRVGSAYTTLQEAHALAVQDQDRVREALALGSLGDVHLVSRRMEEAERLTEASVAVARQATDPPALAAALNHLGNVRMAQERYGEALAAYREGIALAKPDPPLAATLLTNAVHAYLAIDNPQEALSTLEAALTTVRRLPSAHEHALGLITLGHLAQELAERAPAQRDRLTRHSYEALTEARALAESLAEVRSLSYATGYLGELYAAAGRWVDAERLFHRALFLAQQVDAPELSARWQWRLGRLLKGRNRPAQAKAAYRAAIEHLESIESALVYGQRGNPRSFRQSVRPVYLELAEIWLEEARTALDDKQRREALRQARGVMEAFKTVELKNYFRDDCVTAQQERNRRLELDSLITAGTAVLYPIVFDDRLVLLISLADGTLRQIDVPVSAAELQATAADFRQHLDRSGNPRRSLLYGGRLYDWLIKPIDPALAAHRVHTLVVVPDETLRAIPFAALYDGHDYLINRYALAITPGLTLTDTGVAAEADRRVLLSGISEPVQGFIALPYVPEEIEQVATIYDSTRLLNDAFREPRLQTQLERQPYSAILFATHSRFSGDPRESFLLAYDDKITLDELERMIRIGQFRDRPVELLVLSACETAQGDERAALGLAGAAVKAGVGSVIASLWIVNDVSTVELVPAFFRHLKNPGLSKAQALQRAQQQLLTTTEYRHPFHWAPFLLIGNWF